MRNVKPTKAQRRVLDAMAKGTVLYFTGGAEPASFLLAGITAVHLNTFLALRDREWIVETPSKSMGKRYVISDAGRDALLAPGTEGA